MGIHSKSEEHVHEEVSIKNQNEYKKKINAIDNSIAGIIKAIQWPSFLKALKYAFYTTICRKAQFRQGSVKPNQYGQISWAL